MKHLVSDFLKEFITNEQFRDKASHYERALKSPDWEFLRDVIYMMKNKMAEDIFSKRYTDLDAAEKDVAQRAYFQINIILDFLLNPVGWINKKRMLLKQPDLKGMGQPNQIRKVK